MDLDNLKPAVGSTRKSKRIGRGQGSGHGKTAGKGHKGAKARSGYKVKMGFEGGQQPLQRRLPKVGFTSRVKKPLVINVNKVSYLFHLEKITFETIRQKQKIPQDCVAIKLIGTKVANIIAKIEDDRISHSKASIK